MTTANDLLTLLKAEEAALRDRNLKELDRFTAEKQRLLDALDTDEDEQILNAIAAQATENAALLEIVRTATRSAYKRLEDIAKEVGAVGYDDGGAKLSYTEKTHSSRHA